MLLYEKISQKGQILEANRSNLPDGVLLRVTYPICRLGLRNANGRVYERAVWDGVLSNPDILEKMKNRCLYGAPEHPEATQPNLKDTSHIITETKLNESDNTVYQTMEVLDTEYGRIIETLLRANCQVGVSTRAEGELEEAKDEQGTYMRVVPKTYKYVTTDFTADPSTKNPYPVAVERKVVQEIKEGLSNGKITKHFATTLLESMQSTEAKEILNTIKEQAMKIGSKVKITEGALKGTVGEVVKVNEATIDISTGEVNINIDKGKVTIVDVDKADASNMPIEQLPAEKAPIEPVKIEAPEGELPIEDEAGVEEEEAEPAETPDIEDLKDEVEGEDEEEEEEEEEANESKKIAKIKDLANKRKEKIKDKEDKATDEFLYKQSKVKTVESINEKVLEGKFDGDLEDYWIKDARSIGDSLFLCFQMGWEIYSGKKYENLDDSDKKRIKKYIGGVGTKLIDSMESLYKEYKNSMNSSNFDVLKYINKLESIIDSAKNSPSKHGKVSEYIKVLDKFLSKYKQFKGKNNNNESINENADISAIMAYEDGALSDEEILRLFSDLIKSGLVWKLQGAYGRQAKRFIDAGYIDRKGTILKGVEDANESINEGKYSIEVVDKEGANSLPKITKELQSKFEATKKKNPDGFMDAFESRWELTCAEIAKALGGTYQVRNGVGVFNLAGVSEGKTKTTKTTFTIKDGKLSCACDESKKLVSKTNESSIRQLQIRCSGMNAEKEKALELLEKTEAKFTGLIADKSIEVKALSKKLAESKTTDPKEIVALRSVIERKTKSNKELSESLAKLTKEKDTEIKALEEKITKLTESNKKIQEANNKELIKRYINAKVNMTGIKLHSGAKALLESQTSFDEVDTVFENMNTILRENALHSTKIEEIKLETKTSPVDNALRESIKNAFAGMLGK